MMPGGDQTEFQGSLGGIFGQNPYSQQLTDKILI